MIKATALIGSLQQGKLANFIVTSAPVFDEEAVIYENWIQGKKYTIEDKDIADFAGVYDLKVADLSPFELEISGKATKPEFKVKKLEYMAKTTGTLAKEMIALQFKADSTAQGNIRLSGWATGKNFKGEGQLANGNWVKWEASYQKDIEKEAKKESEFDSLKDTMLGQVIFPFNAYGVTEKPVRKKYLLKNATVWTNEVDGIIENADVWVENGKIKQVGKNLNAAGAEVIDGTGKHLTSGIIDEHSHIAIDKGVNEGSQAVTAEVRIGDVVNSEDINIYRQLAGGVTAAQLLHGSANPIGGQSALVKLRWGVSPEEMKIQDAPPFIKFALGENVKQSNWGDFNSIRFPQTRMGVEQVFYDAFTRAKEYKQVWATYNKLSAKEKSKAIKPRRDLELETLVNILDDKHFISCHSYVQSEINMLIKAAEDLGFRVNTFTHILEGYKVADKMKQHGAGGSTFADWWAYKFEVRDAIPYNAALMNGEGVVTAINSDDAEMGRRLNQEAAKTVKYGGVSEEEAWKMVTLNPARLLHLDGRMGSIKPGKDADLVLWTDNPLSIYAQPEKTMIDGIVYFDMARDAQLRKDINAERARIIQKMAEAKAGGATTQKPNGKTQHIWHCEDMEFQTSTTGH